MPNDQSASESIKRLAYIYALGEIALKRMLIDGQFLSADNSYYEKTITRSVAESVKGKGELVVEEDPQGDIVITYKGFMDAPEG